MRSAPTMLANSQLEFLLGDPVAYETAKWRLKPFYSTYKNRFDEHRIWHRLAMAS